LDQLTQALHKYHRGREHDDKTDKTHYPRGGERDQQRHETDQEPGRAALGIARRLA
jgi:hypothetical protein